MKAKTSQTSAVHTVPMQAQPVERRPLRYHIRRFWSLPIADQWLLVHMVVAMALVKWGLHTFGFQNVYRLLYRLATQAASPTVSHTSEVQRHERLLLLVCRHIVEGPCLTRALVLWCLLKRRGIETTLRFGVRKHDGQLESHAWMEYQGQPLAGEAHVQQGFSPFTEPIVPRGMRSRQAPCGLTHK